MGKQFSPEAFADHVIAHLASVIDFSKRDYAKKQGERASVLTTNIRKLKTHKDEISPRASQALADTIDELIGKLNRIKGEFARSVTIDCTFKEIRGPAPEGESPAVTESVDPFTTAVYVV